MDRVKTFCDTVASLIFSAIIFVEKVKTKVSRLRKLMANDTIYKKLFVEIALQ